MFQSVDVFPVADRCDGPGTACRCTGAEQSHCDCTARTECNFRTCAETKCNQSDCTVVTQCHDHSKKPRGAAVAELAGGSLDLAGLEAELDAL